MAYDLTNFTDYIAREGNALTKTLFAGNDTGKFALFMAGVKGSTSIPHLSGKATLQSGSCASPSGDVDVNEVILTVKPFTVYESFCEDDLQTKLPNTVLAPGSNNGDNLTWEEAIVAMKIADINEELELTYWQGNTASGDHQLFNGFIKLIDADSNVISGNTSSASTISKANVKSLVEDMRTQAPAKVKRSKNYVTLVGDDVFDMYIAKEKEDNLYHYKPEHDEGVYELGGGQGKLIRVYGLNGTDRMFASVGSNFVVGSDVDTEKDVADVFYDKVQDTVNIRVKAKAGVQIQNADEIVEFTISA